MPSPSRLNLKAAPWKIANLAGAETRRAAAPARPAARVRLVGRPRARAARFAVPVVSGRRAAAVGAEVGRRAAVLDAGLGHLPARRGHACAARRSRRGRSQPGSLFVLDGQQRLTSIFRVIFRSRIRNKTTPDPDLLVALSPRRGVAGEPVSPAFEDAAAPDEGRAAGPRRGAVRRRARRQREPGRAARAGRMADRRGTSCSSRRWIAPTRSARRSCRPRSSPTRSTPTPTTTTSSRSSRASTSRACACGPAIWRRRA